MSKLTLIRHGQGTDQLTELGHAQAQQLGEHLAQHAVVFEQVITGSLKRQVQTAQAVADAYAARGLSFPDMEQDAGWDEYEAGPIMTHLSTELEASDPAFAKLAEASRDAQGSPEQGRHFQRLFEAIMIAWTEGRAPAEGVQSFDDFHAGVIAARDRVMAGPSGRSVAVFTSGGPIGVNVGASVSAPPGQSVRINWRVRNVSITEFTFSTSRVSLDSFNGLPHLIDAPQLVTYR